MSMRGRNLMKKWVSPCSTSAPPSMSRWAKLADDFVNSRVGSPAAVPAAL